MEALLVVDIQPETVKPRHAESYMETWNKVIGAYDPDVIAYIANLRPFSRIPSESPFARGLDIVSNNIFFKCTPDAFSNAALCEWMDRIGADSVRIIGIDGNWCIKATALGASKRGLSVTVISDAVSSKNEKAFRTRTIPQLRSRGIHVDYAASKQ